MKIITKSKNKNSLKLKLFNCNTQNYQNKSNPKIKEDFKLPFYNPINEQNSKTINQEAYTNVIPNCKGKNNSHILKIYKNKSFNSSKTFADVPNTNLLQNSMNNNKKEYFRNHPTNINNNFSFNFNVNNYLKCVKSNNLNHKKTNASNTIASSSINELHSFNITNKNKKKKISKIKKQMFLLDYSQKQQIKSSINLSLLNNEEQKNLNKKKNLFYENALPMSTKNLDRILNYEFSDNSLKLKPKYSISNLDFHIKYSSKIKDNDLNEKNNGQITSVHNRENNEFPILIKKLNVSRAQHQKNLKIIEFLSKENEKLKKEYSDLQNKNIIVGANGKLIKLLEMKTQNSELKKKNKSLVEELKTLEIKFNKIIEMKKNVSNNRYDNNYDVRLNSKEFLLNKIKKLEKEFQELVMQQKMK